MSTVEKTKAAIIALLRSLKAGPSTPISLYEIGKPLVPDGYPRDELVNALYELEWEGIDLGSSDRSINVEPVMPSGVILH